MRLSDFFPAGGSANNFNLTAGAALSQNDTVLMGPDGLGYPAICTDYAAVANAYTQIVAQTTIDSATYSPQINRVPSPIIGADGSVYILSNSAGSGASPTNFAVRRYSSAGALLGSVILSNVSGTSLISKFFKLSNGNYCAVFGLITTGVNLYYCIIDPNLNIVVPTAAIETSYSNSVFDATPLSGGGFAVCYQLQGTPASQRLAVYSNTGAVTMAPTTIQTWTGTANPVNTQMAELSSLNIAISFNSHFTTTVGLYYGIFSPVGASVLAISNLDTVSTGGYNTYTNPEISSLPGYFAVARQNGTNMKAFVFNNAGALQGSAFSQASNTVNKWGTQLLNDGAKFYMVWSGASVTNFSVLPTTGTGYTTKDVTSACPHVGTSIPTSGFSAFTERGFVVLNSYNVDTSGQSFGIVDMAGNIIKTSTNFGTGAGTTGLPSGRVTPLGDYTFHAYYEQANVAGQFFYIGKYANSSILGSCASATPVGTLANIAQNAGSYPSNKLGGTSPKTFDHTTGANQYGNKGVLLTNGIVLKGM